MKAWQTCLGLPFSHRTYEGYFKCLWLKNFCYHLFDNRQVREGWRALGNPCGWGPRKNLHADTNTPRSNFSFLLIPFSSGRSSNIDLWLGNTALQWQLVRITFSLTSRTLRWQNAPLANSHGPSRLLIAISSTQRTFHSDEIPIFWSPGAILLH